MKIVFAGSPDVAVPTLEALLESQFEVAGVLTRPPARTGRRGVPQETPVAAVARHAGVPILETNNPSDQDSLEILRSWEPDLGVVVAYGAILREDALAVPKKGWINLHFSDLPRWRGAAPVQWAIRDGDSETATAVFQLERGLDTGPVYSKITHPLRGTETSGDLLHTLSRSGAAQVLEVTTQIAEGTAVASAQPESGISVAPRLSKEDGFVNFTGTAAETDRVIRSVTPNPGAWTVLPDGKVLRLSPVSVVEGGEGCLPGQVSWTKKTVTVHCGHGAVQLGEVAPAGKKWMEASAWLRGARWQETDRLGGVDE